MAATAATCRLTSENDNRTLAEVSFDGTNGRISTTVTHSSTIVSNWITETRRVGGHGSGPCRRCLVALDVTCDPNGSITLLQLCVGSRCLIYQLSHRDHIRPPVSFMNSLVIIDSASLGWASRRSSTICGCNIAFSSEELWTLGRRHRGGSGTRISSEQGYAG
uniref:Uncharacterized protein n=1 Tax=Ananas comosus var. bracteatus TaxID=296719 RepID=A0A6V7PJ65_ANACO|nr:unnamed protein product [Ananas comosus var. bracteatus]